MKYEPNGNVVLRANNIYESRRLFFESWSWFWELLFLRSTSALVTVLWFPPPPPAFVLLLFSISIFYTFLRSSHILALYRFLQISHIFFINGCLLCCLIFLFRPMLFNNWQSVNEKLESITRRERVKERRWDFPQNTYRSSL